MVVKFGPSQIYQLTFDIVRMCKTSMHKIPIHRPSGLHSHFRSRFGHEEGVLVTENYFVVDGNMIDFCPRYLLDF